MKPFTAAGWFWIVYAAILSAGLACCTNTHAAQVEVGIGQSHGETTNSVWYEQGLPYTMQVRPPAFMVGLTGDLSPSVAWHADVVDLGRMSVDSWDVPVDQTQYDWQHGGCKGPCPPLVHVLGSGQVLGMAFTAEPHMQIGAATVGVEAGPFLYVSQWEMSVPNWREATGVSGNVDWSGTDSLSYSNTLRPVLGGVVGVSVSDGRFGLSLRHYFVSKTGGAFPALWKGIDTLMITYRF